MIILEHGPGGVPALFDGCHERVQVTEASDLAAGLARLDAARAAGGWIAGYAAYEAGYALEPRLARLMPKRRKGPLLSFGVFDGPQDPSLVLDRAAAEAPGARLAALRPSVSGKAYAAAFARVAAYIAAGDIYQVNLTFPLTTRLTQGSGLGLYGALRDRQPVGFGAYLALGTGPVVLSRSPELFVRITDGLIEARPMKGTAPRDPDPVRDAAVAAALQTSEKDRAENLMIVDLLRNDISRICEVGSVRVPELFHVDSFATLHQMSSRVHGRLKGAPGLSGLMAALFPCGSITGAPKIRAMEIIRELEPRPRGAYCGAIGWMAPDGDACFNVAIRTLSLFDDGRVVMNVGGGVVHDSTAEGEREEALWKARFARGLAGPV